jgi:predicted O-linked N-acetylglucosamine transferase (SPINDLY family)
MSDARNQTPTNSGGDAAQRAYALGMAMRAQGKIDEAIAALDEAVRIEPAFTKAHRQLGLTLQTRGRFDEAANALQRAVNLAPENAQLHIELGIAFRAQAKLSAAVDCFQAAVRLAPTDHFSHSNLGIILLDQGRVDEAVAHFEAAIAVKPDFLEAHSNLLYAVTLAQSYPYSRIIQLVRRYEDEARKLLKPQDFKTRPIDASRKLRIAFLTAEIGNHPVSYFLESYIRHYDRQSCEVSLYIIKVRQDERSAQFLQLVDKVVALAGKSDSDIRAGIINDDIDILIDTTGHMAASRLYLMAHRCAQIQCHYLGFQGDTGLVDYFIGDGEISPPALAYQYTEEIARLRGLWMVYAPPQIPIPLGGTQTGDQIVFGCFNNLTKVREETLEVWSRALTAIPGSSLILKDRRCADEFSRQRIASFLAARGVDRQRLTFYPQLQDWREHMTFYNRVDIALDTCPLSSGSTGFDALYMGTPVVAMRGDWMGGRMSSSMLKALGQSDWIAENAEQYASIVRTVAATKPGRLAAKEALRSQVLCSPLCDGRALAADLTALCRALSAAHNAKIGS